MSDGRPTLEGVLDPSFVSTAGQLDIAALRRRRDEAREEEEVLSFVRRWLHGKMDILRSELVRRRDGSGPDDLIERLTATLGEGASGGSRGARSGMPSERLQTLGGQAVADIDSSDDLARLPDLTTEQIEALVQRLVSEERRVSEQRRKVHHVIDELAAELTRRYRSGSASVDDILGGR
ncbi:MAG TPA: hypothetical protein VM840_09125 [Actinomycetota bacterium]|jgi:hypothetical protein|nr:hypothetical protein [Actinomycetota bacterium]